MVSGSLGAKGVFGLSWVLGAVTGKVVELSGYVTFGEHVVSTVIKPIELAACIVE
jgi:hypothetical protein